MQGLRSLVNWRTFLTGVIVGYILAWRMHWATQLWDVDGRWIDERIPILTPSFGRHD